MLIDDSRLIIFLTKNCKFKAYQNYKKKKIEEIFIIPDLVFSLALSSRGSLDNQCQLQKHNHQKKQQQLKGILFITLWIIYEDTMKVSILNANSFYNNLYCEKTYRFRQMDHILNRPRILWHDWP